MSDKKRKLKKNFVFVCLILFGIYLAGEFLRILPFFTSRKSSNTVQAAASDSTDQPDLTELPAPAPVQRKQTVSIVLGRLGYVLFDDGTATVTDETGAAAGLKAKEADIIIPSHVSYQKKKYTVTAIGQKCFSDGKDGKQNYGRIILPDTIQTIGLGAFYEVSCEELLIPDSVTEVGEYAFCSMTVEKDFYYPAGATEIPRGALLGTTVKSGYLVIPETITRLCYWAIGTSSPVRLLCEPDEIDSFAICQLSGEIEIGGKNGFAVENGMLLNRDKTELIKCAKATSTKIVVPDTVRRIHPFAFCNTEIWELPEMTEWILYGRSGGVEIYLPEGLTTLEIGTFYQNEWIERVFLPVSLEKIEEGVFVTGYPETARMTLVFQSEQVPEIGRPDGGNNWVKEVDVPDAFLKNYQEGLKGRLQYEKIY